MCLPCRAQNFPGFARGLAWFLVVAVPAALVNSGLRLFQKQIQLAFMLRLSRRLHRLYCSNRSYYSASVLGGAQGCTVETLNPKHPHMTQRCLATTLIVRALASTDACTVVNPCCSPQQGRGCSHTLGSLVPAQPVAAAGAVRPGRRDFLCAPWEVGTSQSVCMAQPSSVHRYYQGDSQS